MDSTGADWDINRPPPENSTGATQEIALIQIPYFPDLSIFERHQRCNHLYNAPAEYKERDKK